MISIPNRPWNLADSPPFVKICPVFPALISPHGVISQACATIWAVDLPGNTLDTFGHVCGARTHGNWAGFGHSGNFHCLIGAQA